MWKKTANNNPFRDLINSALNRRIVDKVGRFKHWISLLSGRQAKAASWMDDDNTFWRCKNQPNHSYHSYQIRRRNGL